MNKLFLASILIGFPQLAIAHDGHGVNPQSLLHYFSGAHVVGMAAVAISIAAICYFSFRRRSQR